ncbi:MAG TPA: hypothetical protein VE781_06645 [Kineosporiaceae bacterium]|nr:hypothetical protein [Kineosporiaceae bacterium]
MRVVERWVLPAGQEVAGVALAGDTLAFSGCRPCGGAAHDAAALYLTRRGEVPRVVARTGFRWGTTAVVGLDATALVWLDEADVRDAAGQAPRWALRALDRRSGRTWTVAEGGGGAGLPRTPVAFVHAGAVSWQVYDIVTSRGPVFSADLRTRRSRRLTADLPGLLRGVVDQGLVVVARRSPAPTVVPDGPAPADAYLVPAATAQLLALTSSHDVEDVSVSGQDVVWRTRPEDGESLWRGTTTGDAPRRLYGASVLTAAAGPGFGVWITREAAPVVQAGAGGRVVTLPDVPADGGGLAVDGTGPRDAASEALRVAVLTVPGRGVPGPLGVAVVEVRSGG